MNKHSLYEYPVRCANICFEPSSDDSSEQSLIARFVYNTSEMSFKTAACLHQIASRFMVFLDSEKISYNTTTCKIPNGSDCDFVETIVIPATEAQRLSEINDCSVIVFSQEFYAKFIRNNEFGFAADFRAANRKDQNLANDIGNALSQSQIPFFAVVIDEDQSEKLVTGAEWYNDYCMCITTKLCVSSIGERLLRELSAQTMENRR